jgi:hypothetical protein
MPRKDLMLVIVFGFRKRRFESILLGFGLVPSLLTTWSIKVIFLQQNNIYSSLILGSFP